MEIPDGTAPFKVKTEPKNTGAGFEHDSIGPDKMLEDLVKLEVTEILDNVKIEDERDFTEITHQSFAFVDQSDQDLRLKSECRSDEPQSEVDYFAKTWEPAASHTSTQITADAIFEFVDSSMGWEFDCHTDVCPEGEVDPLAMKQEPPENLSSMGAAAEICCGRRGGVSTHKLHEYTEPLVKNFDMKEAGTIAVHQQRMPAATQRRNLRQNELSGLETVAGGSGSLQSHVTSEERDDNPCACALCSYTVKWKISVVPHKTKQNRVKSFCCTECNYKTAFGGALKVHMSIKHTGEKKYCCTVCNYKAAQSGHVKRHMLKHTGEKKFLCTECSYKTARGENLETHMSKHNGLKKFCCTDCNYKTAHGGYLKTHMSKHNGFKKFCCTQCKYMTAQGGDLRRHMLTHTGIKKYCCADCDYKTAYGGDLKKHNMSKHIGLKCENV